MLFSGWKLLLQPWSYWHPFHLIRTLGLRVDKTLREIILPGECGGDKLASGSVRESPLCQAEEKGLAGSRGRPRQGRLGGPMLRPPPCLWQTRQWIISPSGTRPSAVGLKGKGAVIQHSAEELPLYVCSLHYKHTYTHTLVCIVCISTVQSLCTSQFPLVYTLFLSVSLTDITLTVSINRSLYKSSVVVRKWSQISPYILLSTLTWNLSCKIHVVQNKCEMCHRATTSCPLQVDCVLTWQVCFWDQQLLQGL